jgi:hypothetical protein
MGSHVVVSSVVMGLGGAFVVYTSEKVGVDQDVG